MYVLLFANVFMLIGLLIWQNDVYKNVVQGSLLCLFSVPLLYSPYYSGVISGMMFYDGLSGVLVFLTCFISLMVSLVYNTLDKDYFLLSNFFSFIVYFLNFILMIVFIMSNIVWFYVFFEASLVPVFIMILGWGHQPERLQAGIYIIIYTICGSLPFLFVLTYFCIETGNFFIFNMGYETINLGWWWLMLVIVFLVKLPIFSVHLWLPKAHVEAPLVGSIILAAILLKLGGYGLIRFLSVFGYSLDLFGLVVCVLGLHGGGVLTLLCMRQLDINSLIAYSSVCHMSVVLGGILSNSEVGWGASVVGMVSHGFCSSGLFVLANMCYESVGSRSLLLMGGFFSAYPSIIFFLLLFSIINSGVPPFVNFMGEVLMGISVFYISFFFVVPLGFLLFFSFAYNIYLYVSVAHGQVVNMKLRLCSNQYFLVLFLHIVPVSMVFWCPSILYGFWC